MKFFVATLSIVSAIMLLSFNISFAYDPTYQVCTETGGTGAASSDLCNTPANGNPVFGPKGIAPQAIELFTMVIAIAATIMIIIGGFEYITSGGDPARTNKAKDRILFAIIGLAVAAVCQSLVFFIIGHVLFPSLL